MPRITITTTVEAADVSAFLDAFGEWARHADIDPLMVRTTDTPSGYPEADYQIDHWWGVGSMTYEVQYLDGLASWRRWTHMSNLASAESSARRCVEFLGSSSAWRVRIREIG
jgi:hypothetical protein